MFATDGRTVAIIRNTKVEHFSQGW